MKAFVAGATGYTGREVVRALVARGVETVAHVRPDSTRLETVSRELRADGARVDTTPWNEDALADALRALRPDLVFALLGTTRARAREGRARGLAEIESYDSVDYGLTSLLLRAAVRSATSETKPLFVYLSAIGAGRPSANPYYSARYKAEGEVRASGLPAVIARPSFITGPDREESRPLERVAALATDGVLGLVGHLGGTGLAARYRSLTAKQLGTALVELALSPVAEPLGVRIVETDGLRRAAQKS